MDNLIITNDQPEREEIDDMLTAVEVAQKLRTTISTLMNLRKNKTGPEYVKVGMHFKYPYKKLVEYIKKQTNA